MSNKPGSLRAVRLVLWSRNPVTARVQTLEPRQISIRAGSRTRPDAQTARPQLGRSLRLILPSCRRKRPWRSLSGFGRLPSYPSHSWTRLPLPSTLPGKTFWLGQRLWNVAGGAPRRPATRTGPVSCLDHPKTALRLMTFSWCLSVPKGVATTAARWPSRDLRRNRTGRMPRGVTSAGGLDPWVTTLLGSSAVPTRPTTSSGHACGATPGLRSENRELRTTGACSGRRAL